MCVSDASNLCFQRVSINSHVYLEDVRRKLHWLNKYVVSLVIGKSKTEFPVTDDSRTFLRIDNMRCVQAAELTR